MFEAILSRRWIAVWQRNLLVWRKLAMPSILANFGEPVLYLLALGYGFGSLIGDIGGMPYLVFLASGIVCSSSMNSATFESLYSAYTRMDIQKTWEGMVAAPLLVDDVVVGEAFWAGTKALISASAILLVAALLGTVSGWQALLALPVILLSGTVFACMGLVVTALAHGYDFFLYYITLFITPMLLFSGVFFPISDMPALIQMLSAALPLSHVVAIVRPLMTGGDVYNPLFHITILLAFGLVSLTVAIALLRRRMQT